MRQILLSTAKILVSAALLYFALRKTDFSNLLSRIDITSASWIALAVLIAVLQVLVAALRWHQISADCGAPLTLAQTARYIMIGSFFNQTLPSSIGGDAMRLWLVGRGPAGWRAATYSIFVDRAIGLIALAVMIVASLPWSYRLLGDPHGKLALLFVDFAALAAGGGFLLLSRLQWPWLKNLHGMHHLQRCSTITNHAIFNRDHGWKIAFFSMLIHVLAVVVAWCMARAIAAPIGFGDVFLLTPPVMLITIMPVSIAGWGVREASMALAFSYAGLPTDEGINISLLFGAAFFAVGALGGLMWISSAEKAEKSAASIEVRQ